MSEFLTDRMKCQATDFYPNRIAAKAPVCYNEYEILYLHLQAGKEKYAVPVDTKAMIADAFIKLTHQKQPDKITIKDIVEHCSISRQAFYYHFQDILDVIEWIVRRNMQIAFEESLLIDDPKETMLYMVRHIADHHDQIRRLLSSQHGEQIEDILMQTFCALIKELRIRKYPRAVLPTADPDTTLRFLAYGAAGVIKEALKSGYCDPAFLCDELYPLTSRVFES